MQNVLPKKPNDLNFIFENISKQLNTNKPGNGKDQSAGNDAGQTRETFTDCGLLFRNIIFFKINYDFAELLIFLYHA